MTEIGIMPASGVKLHDRSFMIYDPESRKFVSAKYIPRLAKMRVRILDDHQVELDFEDGFEKFVLTGDYDNAVGWEIFFNVEFAISTFARQFEINLPFSRTKPILFETFSEKRENPLETCHECIDYVEKAGLLSNVHLRKTGSASQKKRNPLVNCYESI